VGVASSDRWASGIWKEQNKKRQHRFLVVVRREPDFSDEFIAFIFRVEE
jgi:hypothetical protein